MCIISAHKGTQVFLPFHIQTISNMIIMHSVEKCFHLNQSKINTDQWIRIWKSKEKKEWKVTSINKHKLSVYWIFFLPAPIVVAHKQLLDLIKFYKATSLVFFSKTDLFILLIMPGPMGTCILNAKRVPYAMTSVLETSIF